MSSAVWQQIDEQWQTLVATAVLGVERRPFVPPAIDGSLGAALAGLDQTNNERAALGAAALLGVYRRAGTLLPALSLEPPLKAPAADIPLCSARAAHHLQAMLNGTHSVLLVEWLSTLATKRKRVPPALLPAVLDAGAARLALRPLVAAVQGARGRWLAAQNPDWEYAAGLETQVLSVDPARLEEAWQTGTRAARRALLLGIRPAAPEIARALIQSTWASERADDRAALLESLEIGLSMADEPFLEAALDDRSKEVRANAVELLARLPQSRLMQRAIARLEPLLRWYPAERPRLLGLVQNRPARLEIALPEACDKAMARDGVDPKPPRGAQGLGERAQWLHQMLRLVPPAYWCGRWNATPDELIVAAEQSEWSAAVLPAWIAAVWRARDIAWAEAFLRHNPANDELLDILPIERQEALTRTSLKDLDRPLGEHPALAHLRRMRHTWSAPLARMVLAAARKQMSKWAASRDYGLYSALPEFALRLPPELLPEIAANWHSFNVHEQWQGAIDRMLVLYQFRVEMLQALQD